MKCYKLLAYLYACFIKKHLALTEGVMSQLLDVKMEPDTVQHLKLTKDLLLDVEVITRSVIFR